MKPSMLVILNYQWKHNPSHSLLQSYTQKLPDPQLWTNLVIQGFPLTHLHKISHSAYLAFHEISAGRTSSILRKISEAGKGYHLSAADVIKTFEPDWITPDWITT